MKTLTMTASVKNTKAEFNGANEGEQCRVASTGNFLVGMDSAKAGTVVKVTETNMSESDTIKMYADYFMREWHLDESEALESAKNDVSLMASLAGHFELGDKCLVKITPAGRISIRTL